MNTYRGSCHCGQIAFDVSGDIDGAMSCNCSMCQRKGSLLWFVPGDAFTLLTGEDDLATYTFNRHVIRHHFCPTCGIHPFGEGRDSDGNRMVAINIRCLEDIDIESIPVSRFDGRAL